MTAQPTPATDVFTREHVAGAVQRVLYEMVESAIASWSEDFWTEVSLDSTEDDVLGMFLGYIESMREAFKDDPDSPFGGKLLR